MADRLRESTPTPSGAPATRRQILLALLVLALLVLTLFIAPTQRLRDGFTTLVQDPKVAIDLKIRYHEVHDWFAGLADLRGSEHRLSPGELLAALATAPVAATDTTPDPFGFTAQTEVALNATVTSNAVTVSGIDAPTPISLSGGTYSVNGGSYTSVAGTVGNGDTASVRLTSASTNRTQTCATLSIGGVDGTFCATTLALSAPTATAATGVSSGGFNANWSGVPGATRYRLDVSTSRIFGSFVYGYQDLDVGNVLSRSVSGLSGARTYYYRVRAYNAGGPSGNSNTIGATITVLPGGLKTYTVTPCRVVDTRLTSAGVIPAGGSRSFRVTDPMTGQGGASRCGVPFGAAEGIYMTVASVVPDAPGDLTLYPYGSSTALAGTLYFTTGQTISTSTLVPICNPSHSTCDFDLTVTMGPASAHIVIDVTGYVALPP